MPTPEPARKRSLAEIEQRSSKKRKLSNSSTGSSLSDPPDVPTSPQAEKTVEPLVTTSEPLFDSTQDPSPGNASGLTNAIDFPRPTSRPSGRESIASPNSVDPYDVCFGLLCVEATSTPAAALPSECTPVKFNFHGCLLKVMLEDLDQPVAVLLSPALQLLVNAYVVTLHATICSKKQKVFTNANAAQDEIIQPAQFKMNCSLRIIVYGFQQQKHQIAESLAARNYFFQHPAESEIDKRVKYRNPQYLLPPGGDMPAFKDLSIYTCCAGQDDGHNARRNTLGEHERGQIFNIFNTASESNAAAATMEASPRISTQLKRHQIEALVMMVEKEAGEYDEAHFPSLWPQFEVPGGHKRYQNIVTKRYTMTRPPPLGGGILADEMGLGKTLTALSLICYSLDQFDRDPSLSQGMSRSTLIIAPKSTIYAWEKQIKTHIRPDQVRWITYQGIKRKEARENIHTSDIVLTTYDTLRADRANGESCLFEQSWARVVLDEAHRIRNSSSRLFSDVLQIEAGCRWCLTGTPIQNSLDDFGSLLAFIKAPHLETKQEFDQYIASPMKKRSKEGLDLLRKVVAATCLRRTKANYMSTLKLPRKIERTEHIEMGRRDRDIYDFFKRFSYQIAKDKAILKRSSPNDVLVLISILRLICDHGEALLPKSALRAWKNRDMKALTWETLKASSKRCAACDSGIEELNTGESTTRESSCGHLLCESCETDYQGSSSQWSCLLCEAEMAKLQSSTNNTPPASDRAPVSSPRKRQWPASAKVEALIHNLSKGQEKEGITNQSPKSVVFSFWTKMLDLIAAALKENGSSFSRIDGQASVKQRKKALETFENDPKCTLMLASISAAGEGIDLTAGNSVHIVEPHWNPMAEAQAIDRVHRIGQPRDVEVVRYIVNDSIESYIQWVQMDKIRLIKQSLSASDNDDGDVDNIRWKELLKYLE